MRDHLEVISKIKDRLQNRDGIIMNLMISGAHLYGFESEDSDIDYRGAYITNTRNLLGLRKGRDVIEINHEGNDICLFELSKDAGLALAGNCNVLEHINAKQIVTTHWFNKYKVLINNAWGKNGIYNSYKGMATFNYKKFILQGKNTNKKYLYVFRGLLAGIYALQQGRIEPNIVELNKHFKSDIVKELIKAKKEGKEKEMVNKDFDTGQIEMAINTLFVELDYAFTKSKIPERPTEDEILEVNKFIVQTRLDMLEELK